MIHATPGDMLAHLNQLAAMATSSGTGTSSSSSTSGSGGTQNMFMQLLTTQLENQSPLNPVDPDQMTTEIVQLNMLDQLSQINQTLTTAFGSSSTTGSGSGTGNAIQGAH